MGTTVERASRRRTQSALRLVALASGGAALLLVLAACGSAEPTATPTPEPSPTPTATAGASAPAEPAAPEQPTATPTPSRPAWEIEWAAVVAGAKEEGELVIVGGSAAIMYRPVFDRFGQIFDVNVKSSGGSSRLLVDRILAERSAGSYTVDHFLSGEGTMRERLIPSGVLAPIADALILPEVIDPANWYGGRLWYADEGEEFVIRYGGNVEFGIQFRYNTDRVSQEEFLALKSMWDLIDERWVGAHVAQPPTLTGTGLYGNIFWDPRLGVEWLEKFFNEMDVTFLSDKKLITDGLAQGKYAFCLACSGTWGELDKLRALGAPVGSSRDRFDWEEGTKLTMTGSDGMMNWFDRAPHQNAAKALVNWWLSKEGQTAVHTLTTDRVPPPTLREDVTEWGYTAEKERRIPGVIYFRVEDLPNFDQAFADDEIRRLYAESRQ